MNAKTVVFTMPKSVEIQNRELGDVTADKVLVKTEYTVVSGGTERAYLMGMQNTSQKFPTTIGYCGIGHVLEVGSEVTDLVPGDRVLVYHGRHASAGTVSAW